MSDHSGASQHGHEEHEAHEAPRLSRRRALQAGAASVASMAWLVTLGHGGADLVQELAHLARGKPMTATRLIGILQGERAQWNALLAQVGPHRMEIPGVEGTWSVKELVAHLTWYERAVVEGAQEVLSTGVYTQREYGGLGMDERNAIIATESRARPVGEVLAEADGAFNQLLQLLAVCPDDLLNNARHLGLPNNDVPPWMLVADNSYAHYQQHAQSIRAWLARQDAATHM